MLCFIRNGLYFLLLAGLYNNVGLTKEGNLQNTLYIKVDNISVIYVMAHRYAGGLKKF